MEGETKMDDDEGKRKNEVTRIGRVKGGKKERGRN